MWNYERIKISAGRIKKTIDRKDELSGIKAQISDLQVEELHIPLKTNWVSVIGWKWKEKKDTLYYFQLHFKK